MNRSSQTYCAIDLRNMGAELSQMCFRNEKNCAGKDNQKASSTKENVKNQAVLSRED
jgi:hypothetical protein